MRLKYFSIFAALCFCSLLFIQTNNAQQSSSELLESIPQVEEKLNSIDIKQRISVLDALVVYQKVSGRRKNTLAFNLSAADYAFVIKKIFEKDLSEIDILLASQTLSKIEFLMKEFKLKDFAKNLVEYIPKFMPNGLDFPRIGIQYGILATLKVLQAKEFAPQIALLLQPSIRNLYREALSTLVELRAKEAVPALLSLLYDKDNLQRYYALESLVKVDGREAVPHIAKLLEDENVNNRYWALDALVKLNARETAPQFWKLLDSGQSVETESYAIAALIAFGQRRAIPLAIARITEADDTRRGEMMQRLFDLKATAIVPSLIAVLENNNDYLVKEGKNSHVRAGAINMLGELQAREAIPVLRDYVRNKRNSFLRVVAVTNLGLLNAAEAVDDLLPLVIENATGNAAFDASQTAIALARIGERRTWKRLIDFASSPNCTYGSEIISTLNRHIDSKLWQKTQIVKVKGIDYKSIKVNAEFFSAESKIPLILDFHPERDKSKRKPLDDSGYPWMRAGSEMSLDAALLEIIKTIDDGTLPQTFTFIFDDGTIRVLPFEKAVAWWRKNILTK